MKNLDFLIFDAGFNFVEFAEEIEQTPRYLGYIRVGDKFPSKTVLSKMAKALKITENELFEVVSKIYNKKEKNK